MKSTLIFKVLTSAMEPEIPVGSEVYVETTDEVEDEDIVLCRYKGTLILRMIRFYDHRIVLVPFNRDYFSIQLKDLSEIEIVGRVVLISTEPRKKKWFDWREVFYVGESPYDALHRSYSLLQAQSDRSSDTQETD